MKRTPFPFRQSINQYANTGIESRAHFQRFAFVAECPQQPPRRRCTIGIWKPSSFYLAIDWTRLIKFIQHLQHNGIQLHSSKVQRA